MIILNIDDITRISHKKYSNKEDSNRKIIYFKRLVTRILICLIILMCSKILFKVDKDNSKIIKEYVFNDSLKFTKINNWYQNKVGTLIPNVKESNTNLVFNSEDLKKCKYEEYLDGVKLELSKNTPISSLESGIVVYMGEKENYGYTIIIQGNDGVDYWYANIGNSNVNLYDYLDKNTIIGEALDDYIIVVLEKDHEYLKYDEYI